MGAKGKRTKLAKYTEIRISGRFHKFTEAELKRARKRYRQTPGREYLLTTKRR